MRGKGGVRTVLAGGRWQPSHRPLVAGLTTATALALSAIGAASASAWTPTLEVGAFPVPISIQGGPSVLETEAGGKIECTDHFGALEIENFSAFSGALWFSGCKSPVGSLLSLSCKSPGQEEPGDVVTGPLRATLRYIVVDGQQVAGLIYKPQKGETIASLTCQTWKTMTIKGALIGELAPLREWTTSLTLSFVQSGGVQLPSSYLSGQGCASIPASLETASSGIETFDYEPSGFQGVETITTGSPVMIAAGECGDEEPITTISDGPSGTVFPDISFSLASSWYKPTFECAMDSASFEPCAATKAYSALSPGPHLFRARAVNSEGERDPTPAEREFTVVPEPHTTITSLLPTYTSHEPPPPIEFVGDIPGSAFECRLDSEAWGSCSSPYTLKEHLAGGWHSFQVRATDPEGYTDPTPATWQFNTDIYPPAPVTSKLVYPEDGKKTASYYTLKAEWGSAPEGGGVTGVTFQFELPNWKVFKTIPEECVIDGKGNEVAWPLPVTNNPGHSEPVFLDAKACRPFQELGFAEKEIKFRAVFDGGVNAAGATEPSSTEFVHKYNMSRVSTDATEVIGPVSLDLLTGSFTISRTDVSIPVPGTEANLEFTRVYDSTIANNKPGYSFVLGGWWQPSTPVEAEYEGEAWTSIKEQVIPARPAVFERECWNEEGETVSCGATCPPEFCEEWEVEEAQPEERWIELLDNEGAGIPFEISGASYIAPDYAKELSLIREDSEHIVLSDSNGTHTIFTLSNDREYLPKEVSFQATPKSVRMVYENVGHFEGLRLMREIGPAPPGVTCGDWTSIETPGCRTLKFEYLPTNEWASAILEGPRFPVHPQ